MTPALWALFAVFFAGVNGLFGLDVHEQFELGVIEHRPVNCREAPDLERDPNGLITGKGKAATWTIDGAHICERGIFNYGERKSLYDFAAEHSTSRLQKLASEVAALDNVIRDEFKPWLVQIESDDPELGRFLRHALIQQLTATLGPGRVGQALPTADATKYVRMTVNPALDPELMLRATAVARHQGKELQWRL